MKKMCKCHYQVKEVHAILSTWYVEHIRNGYPVVPASPITGWAHHPHPVGGLLLRTSQSTHLNSGNLFHTQVRHPNPPQSIPTRPLYRTLWGLGSSQWPLWPQPTPSNHTHCQRTPTRIRRLTHTQYPATTWTPDGSTTTPGPTASPNRAVGPDRPGTDHLNPGCPLTLQHWPSRYPVWRFGTWNPFWWNSPTWRRRTHRWLMWLLRLRWPSM